MNLESVRESLGQAPRIVEGLIAAAPLEALTWREAEGTWNIVEVLCHIADGEITDWMPRIERILGGGRFLPFDRWATHDMAHVAQIARLLTRSFGRDVGPWKKYFSLLQGDAA